MTGTAPARSVEVVVYGATSAGVCAAVAAARSGAQTVLVEPGRHVGGMTSGGLGYTDVGDVRVLGGLAREFREAVAEHYGVAPGHYAGPEPHVAEQIMLQWLEQAGVDVWFNELIDSVVTVGTAIDELVFASGSRLRPGVAIDASYEGDLLAAAGVETAIGRESRSLHGERFAGRQEIKPGRHSMPWGISPFIGDPAGRTAGAVLPQVRDVALAEVGEGDGGVMSFGYRVCLTTAADRIPFERPSDYDEGYWELGRRYFSTFVTDDRAGRFIGLEENLPGGKCDGNSLGPVSLSVLDGSAWEYPAADPVRREQLRAHHERHTRGFLWFLRSDPSVPAHIRDEMARWGWPADEFADTDHLPHQLYVREARRMQSDLVLTEHDLVAGRRFDDTIALGSYHIDIREVQRAWQWAWEHPDAEAHVVSEGYLSVGVPAYGIPYRALLPRREECSNLLAAVCVSASHVAFSSLRMEPQYQMLGQAAGVAAALAVATGRDVHEVNVDQLQSRLRDGGAEL